MKTLIYLCVILSAFYSLGANAAIIKAEFVAERGTDIARGYFSWSDNSPVVTEINDGAGNGKILWEISGGIGLNAAPSPMTSVTLEVMNNWFIDAPVPNSLIGDQYTFFGTAGPASGLFSVQNFYFRDESSLLLSSILQPSTQVDFDQFPEVRVDLFFPGAALQTFELTEWKVTEVPVPAGAWLFGSALIGLAGIGRKRRQA